MTSPTVTPATAAAHVTPARRGLSLELRAALAGAVLLAVVGVTVGYAAFVPESMAGDPVFALDGRSAPAIFVQILGRNAGAAGLLASGYVTFGLSSVAAILLTSTWIGATVHALAAGPTVALSAPTVLYIVAEFVGLLLAATAGLLAPAAHVLAAASSGNRPRRDITGSFLRLLLAAAACIVGAAAVETAVILSRL
ncbi:MAG TPA: hypothetical protein P5181_00525 [Dermatophilaceae bacterium]|nr:hypothetical protein [Dermatophilaceae bacterium]